MWIRLSAGGLAFYCLLLSQSRTAIVTAIVSGICGLFVGRKWNWKAVLLGTCALALVLALVDVDGIVASLQSTPALVPIVQRFQQQPNRDISLERPSLIASGLEAWSHSPIFGLGYNAPDARFENAYLSLACETGAVGLLLYLLLVALLGVRIQGMLRTPAGSDTCNLGGYLLCVTVFILVHGMGERTHGFQIGSLVSNVWALLAASAFGATLLRQESVR
jgi:O-antigen ligase